MSDAERPRDTSGRHGVGLTLLLGALGALPPLSIDLQLPALPDIAATLGVTPAATGMTLSLFMTGFALAQLAFGPISDRFGRRGPLIAGCALYAAAGLGAMLAATLHALLAWRFVQGCGAGAGSVLAFAIVSDRYAGNAARVKLSYVTMVMTVAPIVAPTLGAALLMLGNWRVLFGLLAVAGAALTTAVVFGLAESHRAPDRYALAPARLLANYGRALRSRRCIGHAIIASLSFGALFAYVSGSPFVMLEVLGLTPRVYGALFGLTAAAIMAGAATSGALARRHVASARVLAIGLWLAAAAGILVLGATLGGVRSLAVLIPLFALNTFCIGLISPNAAHGAIETLPEIAGVASAVLGCTRMLGGALASACVATLFPLLGATGMSLTIACFALASLAVWRVVVPRNVVVHKTAPAT